MHELSIAMGIVEAATEEAERRGLKVSAGARDKIVAAGGRVEE